MSKTNFLKKKECNYDNNRFLRLTTPNGMTILYHKKLSDYDKVERKTCSGPPTESYRMTILDLTKPTEK